MKENGRKQNMTNLPPATEMLDWQAKNMHRVAQSLAHTFAKGGELTPDQEGEIKKAMVYLKGVLDGDTDYHSLAVTCGAIPPVFNVYNINQGSK